LLISENVSVTVTRRSHKRGAVQIPEHVNVIHYDERYKALEMTDIVVSATTSPHITLSKNEIIALPRIPEFIVDLAVPRDVEPSVKSINGITLLTIDDISGGGLRLSTESVSMTESIIAEHIERYNRWLSVKDQKCPN